MHLYATLQTLGTFLLILATIGIPLAIYLKRNRDIRTPKDLIARLIGLSEKPSEAKLSGEMPASIAVGLSAPKSTRLHVAEAHSGVMIGDEDITVRASVMLEEMWQEVQDEGDFVRKPKGMELTIKVLDDRVLFQMRERESGNLIWLQSRNKRVNRDMMPFFVGPKPGPFGPAKLFKRNGQTDPIPFHFPGTSSLPSGIYSVVDIGRSHVKKLTGTCEFAELDDSFPFILCREGKDENWGTGWVVYLVSNPKLAQGIGGIFTCEEFEPEKEVKALF